MKRRSVQIPNFYKTFKEEIGHDENGQINQSPSASRKFSKENVVNKLFKLMKKRSQDYLNSKRSA